MRLLSKRAAVLELVGVEFASEIRGALNQACLGIGDCLVKLAGPISSRKKLSNRPAGRSPMGSGISVSK